MQYGTTFFEPGRSLESFAGETPAENSDDHTNTTIVNIMGEEESTSHKRKVKLTRSNVEFMFKHEYLNYSTVCVYKISLRISKPEITNVLSKTKGFDGCIVVLGIKKHLLIVIDELSNDTVHRLFIKSSFLRVCIHSDACIALNHLRYNRMPVFSNFNKIAFAKFLEVCLLFSQTKYEYDYFKQHLPTTVCHNNSCRTINI